MNHSASQHLAVWHHLSTFIDIHFLHVVENNSNKHTSPMVQTCMVHDFNKQAVCLLDIRKCISHPHSHSLQYAMESCLSENKRRGLSCDSQTKSQSAYRRLSDTPLAP